MDDLKFLVLYGVLAGVVFASFRKAFHDPKVCCNPSCRNTPLTLSVGRHTHRRIFWVPFQLPGCFQVSP